MKFNIFYSWQSDLETKTNNFFIKNCLEKSIKLLSKDILLDASPRLDKDTQETTGSPNIIDTIFRKTDLCQIFVCDISIINSHLKSLNEKVRVSPNPNVLIELGYAINRLGWERIICLFNSEYGEVEELPFDIRQNRVTVYKRASNNIDDKSSKNDLGKVITHALKVIIDDYELIVKEFKKSDLFEHDKNIFSKLDSIFVGEDLLNYINYIGNYYRFEEETLIRIRKYTLNLKLDENQYLHEQINEKALLLAGAIENLLMVCAQSLVPKTLVCDKNVTEYRFLREDEALSRISGEDFFTKRVEQQKQIGFMADQVIDAYKMYRKSVKERLFI